MNPDFGAGSRKQCHGGVPHKAPRRQDAGAACQLRCPPPAPSPKAVLPTLHAGCRPRLPVCRYLLVSPSSHLRLTAFPQHAFLCYVFWHLDFGICSQLGCLVTSLPPPKPITIGFLAEKADFEWDVSQTRIVGIASTVSNLGRGRMQPVYFFVSRDPLNSAIKIRPCLHSNMEKTNQSCL